MKQTVSIFLILCLLLFSSHGVAAERVLFDFGWKFTLDNPADASSVGCNDAGWRSLDLPHDWSIEGVTSPDNPMGNDGGFFPSGIGWYRKNFTLPASAAGQKQWLYFEGVYERSEVYVNGERVGGHPYGYTSFYCDVTDKLNYGKPNVVAVKADNSHQKNSRWYTGSGIYRHVWLLTAPAVHLAHQGIFITTPTYNQVKVSVTVANETENEARRTLRIRIPSVGEKELNLSIPAHSAAQTVEQTFAVSNPRLWSPESPSLYTAEITLEEDGKEVDGNTETFGIRSIAYSAEEGLLLNGKPVELNGACVHHDNGILGARAYDRADERRVELLKAAGFNAIRTSHNIPSEAFLDACDRLGMLVIDEAFDGWRDAKNAHDYSTLFDEWWEHDVTAMVLRDRNHPSIFCWSIGNEVIERKKIEIVTTARKLAAAVKRCDPTRPVTSALTAWDADWEIYDPLAEEHDIVGYNYMIHKETEDHLRDPQRVMMQTESYPRDAFRNWALVADKSYIIGDFVWTGMDYLGESGIGRYWYDTEDAGEHYPRPRYPWHGAYCGDIDLIGCRKPISHYRDMLYNGKEVLYFAVREPNNYYGKGNISLGGWASWPTYESWNWSGYEGRDIEVEVISRCPSVRLYLNDQLIGEKPTTREQEFRAIFTVPYTPGTLRAEALNADGTVAKSSTLSTVGEPYAIRATADRTQITADGQDLSFVTLEVVDREGRVVPTADHLVQLQLGGNARIIAAGSANVQDTVPYTTQTPRLWNGRALVVLKSTQKAGSARLQVKADGLRPATMRIRTSRALPVAKQ